METEVSEKNILLSLPETDMDLLKGISDRLGWTINPKSGSLDEALDDIEKNRLHSAKDAEDLISQILG